MARSLAIDVSTASDMLGTVRIGGYPTVLADREEIAAWIGQSCARNARRRGAGPPLLIFSSNGQGIAMAGRDPHYDAAMEAADVIHADGMPVVLASRLLTPTPIRGRSATTDLFHDIAAKAQTIGLNLFVLGGPEAENAKTVEAIKIQYPRLPIAGRRNGYFPREQDADVCAEVVACETDILLVGLGKPLQEIWSHRNRELLRGVGAIVTCGGLYAFLTGDARRAPLWMQTAGLEWLYRVEHEPRRLLRRYLTTNLIAVWRLLTRSG